MRKFTTALLMISAIIIAACGSSKKSTTTASSPQPVPSEPMVFKTPASDGIFAPGDAELAAIQTQFKEVTMDQLKAGHLIYTQGACIRCHGAKNIYKRGEAQWKFIMDDMAERAKISGTQKDAVYKYVLAIKATQPK